MVSLIPSIVVFEASKYEVRRLVRGCADCTRHRRLLLRFKETDDDMPLMMSLELVD
jgi:hypothetical protein